MNRTQEISGRSVLFGDEAEWRDFGRRNPELVTRLQNLVRAIEIAFASINVQEPVDKVLYHLARLCAEDFSEILLLCGNGYGIGAEKLLRGMYERAVTAAYLHDHPEEVQNFLDYHKVSAHKLMKATTETLDEGAFSAEQKRKIVEDFETVKPKFMITACEKCGTKRLNHTWTKLDFVSMARASGALAMLLVPAYYFGTREGHSTVEAIFSRLDPDSASSGEGLVFDGGPQRKRADTALMTAHKIILIVLENHKNHFHPPNLDEPLQTCIDDVFAIWTKSQTS